jgi:hypothetical protein
MSKTWDRIVVKHFFPSFLGEESSIGGRFLLFEEKNSKSERKSTEKLCVCLCVCVGV